MDEKKLLSIALMLSFLGILSLLILVEKIDVSNSDINNSLSKADELVRIRGYIESVRDYPNLTLIKLSDETGTAKIVIFRDNLPVKEKDILEVKGITKEYRGEIEIEAKLVKKG